MDPASIVNQGKGIGSYATPALDELKGTDILNFKKKNGGNTQS